MARDIRGWEINEGDTVAFVPGKSKKLVLGTVLPFEVDPFFGSLTRELYVRIDGPNGKVLRQGKEVVKVGGP